MTYETFRLIVYLIGVPIILYLVVRAVRRTREVSARIREVQEAAERNARDPYGQMAQMFEARELLDRAIDGEKRPQKDKKR
ncbi:MAG TPA: hypothetical protein VM490_01160 [Armatimonadaceae bacterium]|nr:hypothetical protein [Armatimonadaceae bacterium]